MGRVNCDPNEQRQKYKIKRWEKSSWASYGVRSGLDRILSKRRQCYDLRLSTAAANQQQHIFCNVLQCVFRCVLPDMDESHARRSYTSFRGRSCPPHPLVSDALLTQITTLRHYLPPHRVKSISLARQHLRSYTCAEVIHLSTHTVPQTPPG